MIERPSDILTGRTRSLLADDILAQTERLAVALENRSCLIIGGAGSIGSQTTELLSSYRLSALTIVDHDENGLARLMRRLRGRETPVAARNISTLPLDYGSPAFQAAIETSDRFDFILNFAALKHVRSEKDVWSTFQMFDTNILKQADLINTLAEHSPKSRFFSVSTDKAADPVSFMGATKRLMEHTIFQLSKQAGFERGATSARFANVAYSQGSLLESFVNRLDAGVPLAAPIDIRRYFMSIEEAGELCLLAAILGEAGKIYVPDLDAETHLITMQSAAERFLRANGFQAIPFVLDRQAQAFREMQQLRNNDQWPLILTPADTAGEKPYEEFVGDGEVANATAFSALQAIDYAPGPELSTLNTFLDKLRDTRSSRAALSRLTSETLMDWVAELEPAFRQSHIPSGLRLDDRI